MQAPIYASADFPTSDNQSKRLSARALRVFLITFPSDCSSSAPHALDPFPNHARVLPRNAPAKLLHTPCVPIPTALSPLRAPSTIWRQSPHLPHLAHGPYPSKGPPVQHSLRQPIEPRACSQVANQATGTEQLQLLGVEG